MLNNFFKIKNKRRSKKKDRLLFLVYILFLFCLFSCSKDNNNISIIKENPELSCLHEAKYSDIPVPVNYYSVNSFLKESGNSNINNNIIYDNNSLICYSGKLPIESVIDFYLVNLEANGWQFTDYSVFQNQDKYIEGLFFCEKSSKSCIISIRPENINSKNNRNLIYIFLKNKLKIQDKSNQSTKNIDPDIINSKQL